MDRRLFLVTACALALAAGCAQQEADRTSASDAPTLGVLESAYDRAHWEWIKNTDARMLLRHRKVEQCFLDPEPPMHLNDSGLRVTRGSKTIGTERYDVLTAYEGPDFWEAVYIRTGSARPLLGVYAEGACLEEAEKILETYEKRR